jgi:malate dehydrogenase (oxaloacetate-decarboxylating)
MNSLKLHRRLRGKFEIKSKIKIHNRKELALAYTPGVAEACRAIAGNIKESFNLTGRANSLAVVTDGSAVLGLGNIGAEAAMPVMEGKAILFKQLAGIDAFPICLGTQDAGEIIKIIKNLAPTFGAINLEDIAAPKCFKIEKELQELGIPVMHDDQHATAIVAMAGLLNALKLAGKKIEQVKIVVCGAGAAGTAIIKTLIEFKAGDILACDSHGLIYRGGKIKQDLAKITNRENIQGGLKDALEGADVFIGVSRGNVLKKEWVEKMDKPIVFALANPIPEIDPKDADAFIMATGRSDYPNQINNVLAFPGVFRGALDSKAKRITFEMKKRAIQALAGYVKKPGRNHIIPNALDKKVHRAVAKAVANVV